jgi:hypothetical protein
MQADGHSGAGTVWPGWPPIGTLLLRGKALISLPLTLVLNWWLLTDDSLPGGLMLGSEIALATLPT